MASSAVASRWQRLHSNPRHTKEPGTVACSHLVVGRIVDDFDDTVSRQDRPVCILKFILHFYL